MKALKFNHELIGPMLSGSKTTTWRIFDDKDLQVDDSIDCIDAETKQSFAKAKIVSVREKNLGEIEAADFEGHNTYQNKDEMLQWYRRHYGDGVTFETPLKIIGFTLVPQ